MKRLFAATIVAAALAVAGSASADPLRVGVADDWPKFHPCGDVFWRASNDIGYRDLRITVQWDGPGSAIPLPASIQTAVDCALLNDVRPILAIYPSRPSLIGSDEGAQNAFAAFVAQVGQAFSGAQIFTVGNEPNVNRFWQPQFVGGQDAAGKDYEHTLAKSYDALKRVRPDSVVWGPAISSRGNDKANAKSNPGHSPVRFIKAMGDAYRASSRKTPIFDEFNMHPYPPVQDTDAFTKPFLWPQAGAANLDRIKQALWDAFNGTGQPVPAEQAGGRTAQSARYTGAGLAINLDEVGSQTTVNGHTGYIADEGESIKPIDEQQQAQNYRDLIALAACDPDVKSLLFFPLIDEADLHNGFQSGSLYVDDDHKASYDAVKARIASSLDCQGARSAWAHTTEVIGAQAAFGDASTASKRGWSFSITTSEDASWKAGIFKVDDAADVERLLASGKRRVLTHAAVGGAVGTARAYYKPLVRFRGARLPAGQYVYGIRFVAAMNPNRSTTLVSKPFTVGTPAATPPAGDKGKGKDGDKGNKGDKGGKGGNDNGGGKGKDGDKGKGGDKGNKGNKDDKNKGGKGGNDNGGGKGGKGNKKP